MQVGSATAALGRVLAPHLEQGATRALTHFSSQSSVESSQQIAIAGEDTSCQFFNLTCDGASVQLKVEYGCK